MVAHAHERLDLLLLVCNRRLVAPQVRGHLRISHSRSWAVKCPNETTQALRCATSHEFD
jgi:hypothetical protein